MGKAALLGPAQAPTKTFGHFRSNGGLSSGHLVPVCHAKVVQCGGFWLKFEHKLHAGFAKSDVKEVDW